MAPFDRPRRGKHGRRRRRGPISVVALVVIAVLIVVGTVLAVRPGAHHAATNDASDTTVDTASPSGPASAPPDDSIGQPVHVPPVPTGTAFLTTGGDQGVAITPAEATTVLMGLWNLRESAMHSSSVTELRQVEDSVALASDTNVLACRCYVFKPLKAQDVSVIVPRTSRYPAYFFGEVAAQTNDYRLFYLLVITRADAHASWHVSLDSGFSTEQSIVGNLDASGWSGDAGKPVGSDGHGFVELASLWQQAKNSGNSRNAGDFDTTSWLVSDELKLLAAHPQDQPQENGLRGHFSFVDDTRVPVLGVESSSGDLVCGAIQETIVYTAASGHAIQQDGKQQAFGAALSPGLYRSVIETREWQVCILGYSGISLTPFGWDPTYRAAISGVPLPKGQKLPPDPAQHIAAPGDDNAGGSTT